MALLIIDHPPNDKDLELLTEEFPNYIKLTADVAKEILYGGSRLHADAEKVLLFQGSEQHDVWGGGVDLISKVIECSAVANIRSTDNPSEEILDPETRSKFINLVKKYFPQFSGQ